MGRIRQGILGGFSGKVGTVVGGNWKGTAYMRALPLKVKDPKTPRQVSQRTKFALVGRMLQPLTALLRSGWKLYANDQTPANAAMSYTLANAITGSYPDYAIDPGKVLVSRGNLTSVVNASVSNTPNGTIVVNWDDNSGTGSAKQTDKALIAVVNLSKGEAVTITEGAERATKTQTIPIPAGWAGDKVEVYLGFISEDGTEVSNSTHMGTITIS